MSCGITIGDVIRELLESLTGRVSPETIRFYQERLRLIRTSIGSKPIHDFRAADIEGFIATLVRRQVKYPSHPFRRPVHAPLSLDYIRGFERAFRRLCYFAVHRGHLSPEENPWLQYKPLPRRKTAIPKSYTYGDLPALFRATMGTSPTRLRDRALLALLVDTGCRRSGLANLRIRNIDLDTRRFFTFEKGKMVEYHMTPRAATALMAWLQVRPQCDHDYVFINLSTGQPLKPDSLRGILRRIKRRAGVKGPVNPHAFRHGFVKHALRHGADLKSASQLVNHKSITVTADIYGVFERNELDALHDRISPLNDLPDDLWTDDGSSGDRKEDGSDLDKRGKNKEEGPDV